MPKFTLYLLFVPFYLQLATSPSLASQLSATESAKVSATVPITSSPSQDIDTTKPTIPILISPPDGTLTNQRLPTFIWQRSIDENGNYIIYNLYLGGVATYLGIENYGNGLTHLYTSQLEGNTIRLTPLQPLIDGVYDWKVVALDLAGNQRDSALWRLTIDTLAPPLNLITLQDITNPDITNDFSFPGPSPILFIFQTEKGSLVTLTLYNEESGKTRSFSINSDDQGQARFQPMIELGKYEVFSFSQDQAGNQTSLTPFFLELTSSRSPLIPGIALPPLSTLPATTALIATRVFSATNLVVLLAVAIAYLLIARRRHNLTIYNTQSNKPFAKAQLAHQHKDQYQELSTNKHGRAYVKGLSHGSYLLITHHKLPLPISLCLRSPKLPYTLYL